MWNEPLYTAADMREAEAGHDVDALMERAGRAVAAGVVERFPDARRFVAVCGGGANGGDGRIAVRVLQEAGLDAEETTDLEGADVILDALFGTGFSGSPRPEAARLIDAVNASPAPVVAVDVPSGVDASTGEVPGSAVHANVTITFHGEKVGLHVAPGAFHAGAVDVADIGLAPGPTAHARVTSDVLALVPLRSPQDNKYTAGHVLVVGGSPGLTGAPALAATAALRADAGYVTVAAPRSTLHVFEQRLLEPVKRPLAEDAEGLLAPAAAEAVLELAAKAGSVALGPGLGRSAGTKQLVGRLLAELPQPVVVDADGLWELEPGAWPAPRVLTPHEGELARLLGKDSQWVAAHRLQAAQRAAESFRCIVVLKGSGTLVAAPGKGVLVCPGVPALATAGTGDVLTGIIASFLAKRMHAELAAAAGVTAQWRAAMEAPQKAGLVASDLVDALPRVFP